LKAHVARDTYWDPHLSRSNLAEPVFSDLAEVTGLERLVGAGRMVMTLGDFPYAWRWLLAGVRESGGTKYLVLGRPEAPAKAPPLEKGAPVALSWFHDEAWWGTRVHVAQVMGVGLVLQFPVTAYRFPVRDHLWSAVDTLGRLFTGFDVALEHDYDMTSSNHAMRIMGYLNSALLDARPALLFLGLADTVFPGRLAMGEGQGKPPLNRAPRDIDFAIAGADMVGLGWRKGVKVVVSLLVRGDTVAFRSQVTGGRDSRVSIRWPLEIFIRQRRRTPRVPVGAQRVITFEVPLSNQLGASAGVARPFRVIDVSTSGVALVYDRRTAESLGGSLPDCTAVLYDRLRLPLHVEVLDTVPFGERHVRYCCAFRGLERKARRALELLCAKLAGQPK